MSQHSSKVQTIKTPLVTMKQDNEKLLTDIFALLPYYGLFQGLVVPYAFFEEIPCDGTTGLDFGGALVS